MGFSENVVPHTINTVIPLAKKNPAARFKMWLNVCLFTALIIASFIHLSINPFEILLSPGPMITYLAGNFFPPSTANIGSYVPAIIETLLFAVVGTYISAFLSFILGVLMSERLNPNPILRRAVRYFISFLRNIPVLIWASLLVFVFGIGNLVGLMALVLATMGFLSRSYAESMNDIAGDKLEALHASGASYMQILVHGLIPEFAPAWLNWTLFSFEINIRASAILGIVGAGGIGILISSNMNMRNFTEASMLIIILVALVLLTELTVGQLRKRIK